MKYLFIQINLRYRYRALKLIISFAINKNLLNLEDFYLFIFKTINWITIY